MIALIVRAEDIFVPAVASLRWQATGLAGYWLRCLRGEMGGLLPGCAQCARGSWG